MEQFRIYPSYQVLKVGDTIPDIAEGKNAGVWTAAVFSTSNEIGYSWQEFQSLSPEMQQTRIASARCILESGRPDGLLLSLAELPAFIDKLNQQMSLGMRPS